MIPFSFVSIFRYSVATREVRFRLIHLGLDLVFQLMQEKESSVIILRNDVYQACFAWFAESPIWGGTGANEELQIIVDVHTALTRETGHCFTPNDQHFGNDFLRFMLLPNLVGVKNAGMS